MNWIRSHENTVYANRVVYSRTPRSSALVCGVWVGAGRRLRTIVPATQGRSGTSVATNAAVHVGPASSSRRFCRPGRSSSELLPARLLSSNGAGQLDRIRWNRGSPDYENYRLVCGFCCRPLRISVAHLQWRLEADLLDQLSDQLALPQAAAKAPDQPRSVRSAPATSNTDAANQKASAPEPALSAPMPRLPDTGGIFSSSLSENLSANSRADTQKSQSALADADFKLQAEAASLEEVLKNQAHPKNLVAVKKSGTAVVSTPSLTAKTLFLASTHDEFEMLNFNRDWVHVRISGLSRGWIWRDSVELPDSVPDSDTPSNPAISPAAELFHVSREETAVFPGDWEPLKGKSVKIVSVEKADENAKDDSSQLKLAFAKSLLDQNYNELAKKADLLSGIVLIFDSSDGGMIAATFSTLQQWKAGRLSDSALWHQCFFDPPETFVPSGSPGSK